MSAATLQLDDLTATFDGETWTPGDDASAGFADLLAAFTPLAEAQSLQYWPDRVYGVAQAAVEAFGAELVDFQSDGQRIEGRIY